MTSPVPVRYDTLNSKFNSEGPEFLSFGGSEVLVFDTPIYEIEIFDPS